MPHKRRRRLRRNPDFDHEFDWQEFFRPSRPRKPLPYAPLGLWVAADLDDLPDVVEILGDGLNDLVLRNILQERTGDHLELVTDGINLRAELQQLGGADVATTVPDPLVDDVLNRMAFLVAALIDALDEYAPPFAYFGPLGTYRNEGEVASWSDALGFWPHWPTILDAINNAEWDGPPLVGASGDSDVGPGFNGYVLWFVRLGIHHSALYRWHDRQGDDGFIDRRMIWDTLDLYESPGI